MITKDIEKIYVNIEKQLGNLQEIVDKITNEFDLMDRWIYFLNKDIVLNKDYGFIIPDTTKLEPKVASAKTHLLDFKYGENSDILSFEGFNWTIPKKSELRKIIYKDLNYPNKKGDYYISFGTGADKCYICCEEDGILECYDIEKGDISESSNLAIVPIMKIEHSDVSKVMRFIVDNRLEPKDFNSRDILRDLINIINNYPYKMVDNNLTIDKDSMLKDFRNNALRVSFSTDVQEIKEELLNYDKLRADIESYDEKMLVDLNRGHWELWKWVNFKPSNEDVEVRLSESLVARNPKSDIKSSGVVAIDFGTKSTVVVHQDKKEYTLPMRVGIGAFDEAVEEYHYENPTIMEFVDIEKFIKDYNKKSGRPKTSWRDIKISHAANSNLLHSNSENYYSYFSELKQWCGNKDRRIRIKDRNNVIIDLPVFLELTHMDFNPIEVYAYYLGTYINNMHNGIYLNYVLSFPVTYENEVKEKILESFKEGIKKSLPETLVNDKEAMEEFIVEEGANEPVAYAISALQEYEFNPSCKEKVFYGVFDFGGGTTDFDFGLWRGANSEDEERYDYVIEHFGASGDRYLGGENILELLAFEMFKDNANVLREKKVSFMLPPEELKFPGAETLISDSEEAKINMRQLMEILRPITERQEGYKELFDGGKLDVNLYNREGVYLEKVTLDINLEKIEKKLKVRIEKGVKNFFESFKQCFNKRNRDDVEKVNILLAGNSSKSDLVEEIFNDYISKGNKDYCKVLGKKISFELYPPLGTEDAYKKQEALGIKVDRDTLSKPTGKTGVAFGLIDGRKGGTIKIINSNLEEKGVESKFKIFVGRKKKKKFNVVMNNDVDYGKWIKFIDAKEKKFELYYTTLPEAIENKLPIVETDRLSLSIKEGKDNADIYIRAVSPVAIEYVVATKQGIKKGEYLGKIKKVNLL